MEYLCCPRGVNVTVYACKRQKARLGTGRQQGRRAVGCGTSEHIVWLHMAWDVIRCDSIVPHPYHHIPHASMPAHQTADLATCGLDNGPVGNGGTCPPTSTGMRCDISKLCNAGYEYVGADPMCTMGSWDTRPIDLDCTGVALHGEMVNVWSTQHLPCHGPKVLVSSTQELASPYSLRCEHC